LNSAIEQLKLVKTQDQDHLKKISDLKAEVLARFQPMLSPERIPSLKPEEFRDFLVNNGHWSGLARGTYKKASSNIGLLRDGLKLLLNEDEPVEKRLNRLRPPHGKQPLVPGLGRAVLSAILQVTHPEQYGVWNKTSESGMKALKILPTFDGKDGFGERYRKVNDVLLQLVAPESGLGLDLWTLDSAWWGILKEEPPPALADTTLDDEDKVGFGLERFLREFLADNWEKTTLGKEGWSLYANEDDEVVGVEFDTGSLSPQGKGVGKIDILAHQKGKWLVVELKKDQSSDQTVGQVLRYMGWVGENVGQGGELIEGLIIAKSTSERLRLALKNTNNIKVMLYEVDFHLQFPPLTKS
jgi:hypothetical protein